MNRETDTDIIPEKADAGPDSVPEKADEGTGSVPEKAGEIRLLLAADIHGAVELLAEAAELADPADLIVIAGDAGTDEAEIAAFLGDRPYVLVPGNNDYNLLRDLPETAAFSMGGLRFCVTHGHLQNVRDGVTPELVEFAKDRGADILIYGHSHKYSAERIDGIWFVNPGAVIGDPDSLEASCALLTVSADRSVEIEKIHLLDLGDYLF